MSIQASVTGRLTADPDLRFTPSGKAVANLSIAVNHRKKNQQGDWEDSGATFLRTSLWEHQAEQAAEHLRKGQLVTARGRIETRTWQDKEGQPRESLEIQVDDIGPALAKYPPRGQGTPQAQQPTADPWGQQNAAQGDWGTPSSQPAAWDQPRGDQGNIPF